MSWWAILVLASPQEPAILVENPSAEAREELVRASLPLPRGKYRELPWVEVAGQPAPAVPLIRWPDGSLAVVQIQPRVAMPAGGRRRLSVRLDPVASGGSSPGRGSTEKWFLQSDIPIHTELEDPWGAKYRSRLEPDPTAGPGGLLRSSSRVRVRRYRSVHREVRAAEGGRARRTFLGLVAYLTTFVGERRAELTLLLDNGWGASEDGAGPVLGPVRFRSFALIVEDEKLRTRPRLIRQNGLRPPSRQGTSRDGNSRTGTGWRQMLLGPSDQLYLGHATAKAWRFDVFLDGDGVTVEERRAAHRAAGDPLRPLPDVSWTRHTGAFGAHGGPAPGPGTETAEAVWLWHRWQSLSEFGPFGSFGDGKDAAANGTPRNGSSALHNVIRFASAKLLESAGAMVLQQCLRPTPGEPIRIPAATAPLRQGLSPRTMQVPHGFTAVDYEHFSADLLYDYYWMTGDPLARDELARLGRGLRKVLTDVPFETCRGEGWCMQAAVLIARATADAELVKFVHDRYIKSVEPGLGKSRAPSVIPQPPHPDAFAGAEAFDCPWQMAAFLHGVHAMFQQTGDPRYASAARRTGDVMAGPGWKDDEGPKYFISAEAEGRYSMAVGIGSLEGTALMLVSGFVLAEEMAEKESEKRLFRERAGTLAAPYAKAEAVRTSMNSWFQLYLDRQAAASQAKDEKDRDR